MALPSGIKRQGGQNREPTKATGARAQFRQKGRAESAGVQKGRPHVGRGGKRY